MFRDMFMHLLGTPTLILILISLLDFHSSYLTNLQLLNIHTSLLTSVTLRGNVSEVLQVLFGLSCIAIEKI